MKSLFTISAIVIGVVIGLAGVTAADAQLPTVTSVNPMSGYPASSVSITGTNFNTTAASNIVYFGATKATVTAATATSLNVTVPMGATYMPVSVDNIVSHLTGYSDLPYLPTFNNSAYSPASIDFVPKVDFGIDNTPLSIAIGDIDGDGKSDIVVVNEGSNTISVLRNTSTSGSITSSSFATKIDSATGSFPYSVAIGDIDGDGKPDIVVANDMSNTVSVFRNTSTIGSISFAARVDFNVGTNPLCVVIGDIDGDGKPEITTVNITSFNVSVLRNTSTPGSVSFATHADFACGANPDGIAIGDIDGDGKADLVTANETDFTVSVLRNTSTTGSISFAAHVDFATDASPGYPSSVAIGDLDGDGKLDLAVANVNTYEVSVFHNTSTVGSITSSSFATKVDFGAGNAHSIAIGDINGDGKPDIVTSDGFGNSVDVLRNTSTTGSITSGSFAASIGFAVGSFPYGVAVGDLDGDGKPDLAIANNGSNTVSVLRDFPWGGQITGTLSLCAGGNTTLSDTATGGTWSSSNTAVATIGSGTGIVTGVAAGTATISYTYTITGDYETTVVTVNALPGTGTITGTPIVCVGSTTPLSDAAAGGPYPSIGQSYGGGIVAYILAPGDPGYSTATMNGLIAAPYDQSGTIGTQWGCYGSIVGTEGVIGIGTGAANTALIVSACGTGTAAYICHTLTLGGYSDWYLPSQTELSKLYINEAAIGGFSTSINGYWSSTEWTGNNAVFISFSSGGVNNDAKYEDYAVRAIRSFSIPNPAWSSSNTSVATVSTSGVVTGVAAGTATISYTVYNNLLCSASATKVVTVSIAPTTPAAITGTMTVCGGGATTQLSDAVAGGVWSSTNTAVATVGTSGIVSGVTGGTATISYTFTTGCGSLAATAVVTVNGAPIITTVNPLVGYPASAVTITGSGFNTIAANDVVYFGATRATVTTASSTSLSVTVPTGATYQFVTVDNLGCNLTSYSEYPFLPDYNNSGDAAGGVNFDPYVDLTAGSYPYGVAIGDIDGDGKPDLVVSNSEGSSISVFRNISTSGSITSGSFASPVVFATGSSPYNVVISDIDGDGKPDIIVPNYYSSSVSVLRNTSTIGSITTGSFATHVDFSTPGAYCVAVGDIDGDGKPDLVVGSETGTSIFILHNIGSSGSITTGSFSAPVDFTSATGSGGIVISDIDGDGKPDIVVTNNSPSTFSVFRNTSTIGTINTSSLAAKVDFSTDAAPYGLAIGDIDGDGKPDVVVGYDGTAYDVSVFRNTSSSGSVSFAAKVDFGTIPLEHAYFIAIGDVDGDGKPDIAINGYSPGAVSVFRNTSTIGSITTGTRADFYLSGVDAANFIVMGDLDGDGKPDLVTANTNGTVSVLRNDPLTAITGTLTLCGGGGTTTLSDVPGGTWSSANTAVATVGATTGIVTGVGGGTAIISYTIGITSVTAVVTVNGAPIITTVNPLVGYPASAVTITGSGFNTTAANDVVYFGATRATVTAASSTSLSVTVPTGATYQFVTVDNLGCNLTSYSEYPFLPDYNNSGDAAGSVNFDPYVDFAAEATPEVVVIGDIDGDGKPDLVATNQLSNTVSVYRNISTSGSITAGSFAAKVDFVTGSQPQFVAIGDIDGDGKPDLVVTEGGASTLSVYRNTSTTGSITTSSFAAKVDFVTSSQASGIAIGDINGDGKPDLIVPNLISNTVSIFQNTGSVGSITSSSFATKVDFATGNGPSGVAIGDIDGDGKPDIAVPNNGSNTVSVFHNTSTVGSITTSSLAPKVDFTTGSAPSNIVIGDIDGDGKPDITVCNNTSNTISVFRNTSTIGSITTGSFATKVDFITGTTPGNIGIGDIDGDGKPDIAVNNVGANSISVFRNTSTPGSITASSFASKVDFTTEAFPRSIAIGDLDGDGKADIAATINSGVVTVLRNDPLTAITGTLTLCGGGGTTTLSDVPGGTWSSGNTAVATVGSTTGVVTGTGGGTATISYTLGGASVTAVVTVNGAPVITTVNPLVGYPASAVTITGSGFNSTAANDVVYFGATRATVTAASGTSLSVTVPTGATYQFVTVDNLGCNLTSYSEYPFLPDYNNSAYAAGSVNFDTAVVFTDTTSTVGVAIGDIDGDGKPDIVAVNANANVFSVYRNISTSGSITPGSFAPRIDIPVAYNDGYSVVIADIDGDGKLDVLVPYGFNSTFSVFRNTSAIGSISFAGEVDFSGTGNISYLAVGDLDGDGKPDVAVPNYGSNTISIYHNTGSAGAITTSSFATPAAFVTGAINCGPWNVAIGDLDGDGKPDVAVVNQNVNNIAVLRNTSTVGSITSSSFAANVNFTTGSQPWSIAIGDLDGDGKPELAIVNTLSNTISVFHNTSTAGSITTGSFAAKVDFGAGAVNYPYIVAISDLDGDGKPDLAVVDQSPSSSVSILRNTSTVGLINSGSFATEISFVTNSVNSQGLAIGDLDGDGKPDLVSANPAATGSISILRNDPLRQITGTLTLCGGGGTTTLSDVPGGTWSSGNTAVATVGSSTGIVTGAGGGTAIISYTIGITSVTAVVTVSALPNPGTITGTATVCQGATIPLTDVVTGGVWSSSNTAAGTVGISGIITGIAAGTTTISYTVTNGCGAVAATQVVTVNLLPIAGTVTGTDIVCAGANTPLTDAASGGVWSSTNAAAGTVGATGIVTGVAAGTTTISYTVTNSCGTVAATSIVTVNPLPINPAGITGTMVVCAGSTTTLTDITGGGTWSSTNTAAGTVNTTGMVRGVAAGTTTISYTYTNSCGSLAVTTVVTVNTTPIVAPITGSVSVCQNATITVSDVTTGGTWSSGATGIATVVGSTGVVTGVAGGTAPISYAVTNTCGTTTVTATVTVNPLPNPGTIAGSSTVCPGGNITLSDIVTGGVWSSSNTTVATVGTSGIVTGITAGGTATISYAVTNGCGTEWATAIITVNLTANAGTITGTATVCQASTTPLTDAITGGTWSSTASGTGTVSTTGIVTGIATGTTIISYTVSNGCGAVAATQVVTVNPLPVAGTVTGTDIVCVGSNTPLTDATTGGVWSSTNTAAGTVNTSGVVTGAAAGTTTISYTVTNSCGNAAATSIITVNPLPTNPAGITGTVVVCAGGATTPLSDITGGGVWSSTNATSGTVNTTGIVTGIAAGTTTISYTYTNSCGSLAATTVVTVNPQPTIPVAITGTAIVCEGGAITSLSDITTGGVWSSTNTAKGSVDGSGNVTGITAGTTTISYTYTNSCGSAAATTVVTVNPLPINPAGINGTPIVCMSSTTSLTDITAGGVWSSTNTVSGTVNTTGVVTGIAAGTTTISYTYTNSCGSLAATTIVTVNPLPIDPATITGTPVVCAGGSITALSDLTGGGVWSSTNAASGTVNTSGVVTGIAAGTTTISYTYTNSCGSLAATTILTVNPLPINPAGITGTAIVCAGGATTPLSDITAGGTWSSTNTVAGTVNTSGIVTGITTGTTTISYTYTNSCGSLAATTVVTINPLPIIPAAITGTAVVCVGSITSLSDVTGGGVWSSTNNVSGSVDGSGNVAGITAGTTTISYTYTNSCGSRAATGIVTISPLPIDPAGITGTAVVCAGSTTSLSDITAGGTWSSTNLAAGTVGTTGIVTGIVTGTTTISYTYTNSCGSLAATTVVTVNPLPTTPAGITGTPMVCASGATTALTDVTSGGVWSSANIATGTVGVTGIVTGIAAGTTEISYTYTNSCGSEAATVVVTVNPLPNAGTIAGTLIVCASSSTVLNDIATGGVWSSANTSVGTFGTTVGVVTGVSAGTTLISYTVTNGCSSATVTKILTVNPLPTIPASIAGTTVVCAGSATALSDVTGGGTWTSTNLAAGTVNTSGTVTGIAAGTTTISYTYTNSCGSEAVTVAVTVNPLPNAGTITGTPTVCASASTMLSDGATGGIWSSVNTTIATVATGGVVTGVSEGTTLISYTATNSCGSATVTKTVTVNPLPLVPAAITGTTILCQGTTTTLSDAVAGGTWSSNNTTIAGIGGTGILSGLNSGITTINYTFTNSCGSNVASTTVTINPLSTPINGTLSVCTGLAIALSDGTGGGSWSSSNITIATVGSGTGVVEGVSGGNATITYALPTGCVTTATITVNASPSAITGTLGVCTGSTTVLNNDSTGGIWSSGTTTIATIGSGSGYVTSILAGESIISYTIINGCSATVVLTVNQLPLVITGPGSVCTGSSVTLNDAGGGSWSCSNSDVTVGSSGSVIGVTPGTSMITYTLPTGCITTTVMTVNMTVEPSVSLLSGSGDTVCSGTSVLFTAFPLNGGSAPVYQWQINSTITAATSNMYSYIPSNGDIIKVILTSNAVCAIPATVTAKDTITVIETDTAKVSISVIPGDSICLGTPVLFTADPLNGGSDPVYLWFRNGIQQTVPGALYGLIPANGDNIYCKLISSLRCRTSDTVGSNHIVIYADNAPIPSVDIFASQGNNLRPDESDTFTAIVTNGGPVVSYQWLINYSVVPGATSDVFIWRGFSNNDSVTCEVTNVSICDYSSFNSIIIHNVPEGVQQYAATADVRLIPNPNKGQFTIKGSIGLNDEQASIEVTDMLGQVIYKNSVMTQDGNINELIQLNNTLANGMYILNLNSGNYHKVFHFVVEQ